MPGDRQHSWEEAIAILRSDPEHAQLIRDSYLTADLAENCSRFAASAEFAETLRLIRRHKPDCKTVLDIPGGNGIATVAFARSGYDVTAIEPDPSLTVGRGAIRQVLAAADLQATVTNAFGENLPLPSDSFDVVYVRQGLHHARHLRQMVQELARVLKPGGLLFAAREHVVENHGKSLEAFLASQVDHQLYGGENAFTLEEYREAMHSAELEVFLELGPYGSPINLHPNTKDSLGQKILASRPGRLLRSVLPDGLVIQLGMIWLLSAKTPGRLYTFLSRKPPHEC